MTYLKQNEDIKIGRKDISVTMFVVILNLSRYKKVTLSSRGTNTFTAERIASILKNIGIKEVSREDLEEKDSNGEYQPTLKISLACKDLNAKKTSLKSD